MDADNVTQMVLRSKGNYDMSTLHLCGYLI